MNLREGEERESDGGEKRIEMTDVLGAWGRKATTFSGKINRRHVVQGNVFKNSHRTIPRTYFGRVSRDLMGL